MMSSYSFKKKQSLLLRSWHWLNFFTISALLLTALLRKGWLSWRSNSQIIIDKSTAAGSQITPELAKEIAVQIRNQMWDWHYVAGFALAALLLLRIFIFIKEGRPQFDSNWSDIKAIHFKSVKLSYLLFYAITIFMVGSGLSLYFKENIGLNKDLAEFLKETHELMLWFFSLFVIGHLAGIVMAENKEDKGIVSDMINGG